MFWIRLPTFCGRAVCLHISTRQEEIKWLKLFLSLWLAGKFPTMSPFRCHSRGLLLCRVQWCCSHSPVERQGEQGSRAPGLWGWHCTAFHPMMPPHHSGPFIQRCIEGWGSSTLLQKFVGHRCSQILPLQFFSKDHRGHGGLSDWKQTEKFAEDHFFLGKFWSSDFSQDSILVHVILRLQSYANLLGECIAECSRIYFWVIGCIG